MFFDGERRMVKLANFRPRWYWIGTVGWIAWFASPLGPGWLTGQVFSELDTRGATPSFWWLLAGLLAAHIGSALLIYAAHRLYVQGVEAAKMLLRANVINSQVASGGSDAAPRTVPIGDVLSRLRDDPFDVLFLIDNWVDMLGSTLFGVGAVILMAQIDPWATAAGVVPMILMGFGNRLVGNLARRYRQQSRTASSAVGDFLTAAFQASLTVKVGGARNDVLRRFDELSADRARYAVKDDTWNELVWTINAATADLCVGTALIVAARGALNAGEVALFASYLTGMVWIPQRIGAIVVGRRRFQVSAQRLDALVAPRSPTTDHLVDHRPLPILHGPPALLPVARERVPLITATVQGLTIEARGLHDVSFVLPKGSLTVVSGPVGSGKTSLLRGVIGTLELDAGTVCWNGVEVTDRAAFFVPPQCAYVPQVPRLFADSLLDNLRLGYTVADDAVTDAIRLAAFDLDVAELPEGLDTLIGARGVRLSGGQSQRAAAARALVHRPELLVLDDLTSALDVETEQELWERLAAAGFTVLAASNRPVALARADHVIELT